MATEERINELANVLGRLNAVDTAKLLREDLGVESLARAFTADLDKIRSLAAFAEQHAGTVHDDCIHEACSTLSEIASQMEAQAARPAADYINGRESFLDSIGASGTSNEMAPDVRRLGRTRKRLFGGRRYP